MAVKIKPVLKVWSPKPFSESRMESAAQQLVDAVVSIKELKIKGPDDLIVVFPSCGTERAVTTPVFVEYQHTDEGLDKELDSLAAKIGNVLRTFCPYAYIQVDARPGVASYKRHCWSTDVAGTRKRIEQIVAAGEKAQPRLDRSQQKNCYCAENALDHKGPCHHCNAAVGNRRTVEAGKKVLAIKDPAEFQVAADVFVAAHDTSDD